ncbi:MAG: UDP-N-acetylglucosamine 2-epimerase [Hyphomicrobiales bacterium]
MTAPHDRPIKLTILTSSRADYSILSPLLKLLRELPSFQLRIAAFGMHLLPSQQSSLSAIAEDGYPVDHIGKAPQGDKPHDIAASMGATTTAFARYFSAACPDVLLCVGDRFEMLAAVSASVPFDLRVVHLHGGEETAGAMDDVFRHAITAMSWLHLTAHENYAKRVREIVGPKAKDHVFAIGALGIDALMQEARLDVAAFQEAFGVDMSRATFLATFHPETRRGADVLSDTDAFVDALFLREEQLILTAPNIDTYGDQLRTRLIDRLRERKNTHVFETLGRKGYYSALALCSLVIGNSSSGIIEAASFGKPVVNIGGRQAGRLRGVNVIDCPPDTDSILAAISQANALTFSEPTNIYGDGRAAGRALAVLERALTEGPDN